MRKRENEMVPALFSPGIRIVISGECEKSYGNSGQDESGQQIQAESPFDCFSVFPSIATVVRFLAAFEMTI